MANSHGLSPKQAQARANRTKSTKVKGIDKRLFYKSIAKKPLQSKIDDSDIIQVTNKKGNTFKAFINVKDLES